MPLVFTNYEKALSCTPYTIGNGQPSFVRRLGAHVKWPEEEGVGEDVSFNQEICRNRNWKCAIIDLPLIIYRERLSSFNPDNDHLHL